MSKHDVLYVKDMNISDGEDEGDEDIWDDRKLNDAYDKALKMANAEVAKRIAMSTNSQSKIKPVSDSSQSKKGKSSKSNSPHSQKKKSKWRAGMPCRAVYEEDGLEYEACVLTVLSDAECAVRFLGYKNSEIVPINSLKQSLGEEARARQIEEALVCEEQPNDYMSHSSQAESLAANSEQGENTQKDTEMTSSKRSKSPKKKKRSKNQKFVNGLNLPDLPIPMPNLSMLMNMGPNEIPLPPPPPLFPAADRDSEDQAISSMLLSWYMSGYYTGLYQGLKRSKENGRNK